jgi:hypothetical protein
MPPIPLSRRTVAASLLALTLLLPMAACAARSTYPAGAPARAASDTPPRFMVGALDPGGETTEPQPGVGCRNPMVDPRDGTRLTLVLSQAGADGEIGDYAVPEGRYGVGPGELLRLECGTGRVVGIVPHRA